MKTKLYSLVTSLVVVIILFTASLRAPAQGDSVTISAAEFQRMVYSSHLLTTLYEKPELDASLQVLLELQKRNPHADPVAVADLSRLALARYRTNAPYYVRESGSRDEILAAFLDAVRQVPARTNFISANLSLLNDLITRGRTPSGCQEADMIHSGSQSLLGAEGDLARRRTLLDSSVARAQGHAGFRAAMDALLLPETLISLGDSPGEIITNTNSPLHDNPTFQTLLALSATNGNGNLTVSSNLLLNLFTNETQTFWDTINTNLTCQREINLCQPDLLAYLTNQPAIDADSQRLAAANQGQSRKIASATAAILVQSKLMEAKDPLIKLPGQMQGVAEGLHMITDGLAAFNESDATKIAKIAASGNMLAGALGVINLFMGGESAEDEMAREIGNIKTLIGDLGTNMNYRFDRVDQSLTTIFDTLNEQFGQITNYFNAQGRAIAELTGDVNAIRLSLLDVQTDLFRVERNLATFHALDWRFDLVEDMNYVRGFEARAGQLMPYTDNAPSDFLSYENTFYTHAFNRAAGETLSRYTTLPFGDEYFYGQLSPQGATNVYAETLNYIKKCLRQRLGLTASFPEQPILANPQDWSAGAAAWLQLAVENPGHFRRYERDMGYPSRLDGIISKGRDLTNFFRSLTFTGANINWPLYNALSNYYTGKLASYINEVHATEQQYATATNFVLETWRQWDIAAPRIIATNTAVSMATPKNLIAAGNAHSLAIKSDGTAVGWGDNNCGAATLPDSATNLVSVAAGLTFSLVLKADGTVIGWGCGGAASVPAGLSNVMAIAAGVRHSLALKADGTVIGWGAGSPGTSGFPNCGQATIPDGLTNAVAVSGGFAHSLILTADGTVVGLGDNSEGQTNVPTGLGNVVAVAAGYFHSLALKADGTIVGWGINTDGQINVPAGLSNVVAVAAATYHSLALKADGTVIGWGYNGEGATDVPAGLTGVVAIAAGGLHNLALKRDGSIEGWGNNGDGQVSVPPAFRPFSHSIQHHIAAGANHSLALKADGTAVAWGYNDYGATNIPVSASNLLAISAGLYHSLALRADGIVVGWGYDSEGQATIPSSATNGVVAISAGGFHSLALRTNGSVVGWGDNSSGQRTIPASVTNVLAVAGGDLHSLALKSDGTVVGWGDNQFGQRTIPATATNVVAIAAGGFHSLALRADGSVVSWGNNDFGQRTVPATATNVVAIAAGSYHSLALRANGTVVGWGYNGSGQSTVPGTATNVVAIAAGSYHSLALKADGTVVGWGNNEFGQSTVPGTAVDLAAWGEHPPRLENLPSSSAPVMAVASGSAHCLALTANGSVLAWGLNTWGQTNAPSQAQSGIQAVSAGVGHSLALRNNGCALAWGLNDCGQTNIPPAAQSGVVAISAGGKHNLALKANGTVEAWGLNGSGQTDMPASVQGRTVAIGAGGEHSLALKASGEVVAWGGNSSGQTDVPFDATSGVMAIAAGRYHNLALKSNGRVVAWGLNNSGQGNVPAAAQSGVVAIAAGLKHSLAIKADGTVIVWGSGPPALFPPQTWNNVVAVTAGDQHSLVLKANISSGAGNVQSLSLMRAQIPFRVIPMLCGANDYVVAELDRAGALRNSCMELCGAKALIQAVVELGLPYTLASDDVLRGFLYGSEPLMDLDFSRTFLTNETSKLQAMPDAKPLLLAEVAALRHQRFSERLTQCLTNLAASGQPETPRLVGHTLRMLNLLRDSWTQPANSPPPALEICRETNACQLVLYGEPYAHYNLLYSDSLGAPAWSLVATNSLQFYTNLHSGEVMSQPVSASPRRFYRARLPVP